MKVITTVVGMIDKPDVTWPKGWPIPREGETVELDSGPIYVRTVVWYPMGSNEDVEPYVYLVLGRRRP